MREGSFQGNGRFYRVCSRLDCHAWTRDVLLDPRVPMSKKKAGQKPGLCFVKVN